MSLVNYALLLQSTAHILLSVYVQGGGGVNVDLLFLSLDVSGESHYKDPNFLTLVL